MNAMTKIIIIAILISFTQLSFARHFYHVHSYYGPYPYCYGGPCFYEAYGPPPGYYSSGYRAYPVHVHEYHSSIHNEDVGVLAGGIAGGLLGSTIGQGNGQILAIAAGSIFGMLIGGSIGKSMDENDRLQVNRALEVNPVGEPAYWRNARSGIDYRVEPTRNLTLHGNRYCREYRATAIIDGKKQQMYGKACRQPDGSWKVVS